MAARVDGANMEDLDELLTTAEYARERKCSERTIERERTSSRRRRAFAWHRRAQHSKHPILRRTRAAGSGDCYAGMGALHGALSVAGSASSSACAKFK